MTSFSDQSSTAKSVSGVDADASRPDLWDTSDSDLPVIAFALHGGHETRDEVRNELVLTQSDRRREEDPYTGLLSSIAPVWLNSRRSRFEVDLNRERNKAVYPSEVWGLKVWEGDPPDSIIDTSLQQYDAFYKQAEKMLDKMSNRFPRFLVLDLHSYNHRRSGPYASFDPPELNPEINVGTGHVDRNRWGAVIDQFITSVSSYNYHGRHLDVRENVRFRGGHFSAWVQENYGKVACTLAIEVKKFFMNEWTDELYYQSIESVREALRRAVVATSGSL